MTSKQPKQHAQSADGGTFTLSALGRSEMEHILGRNRFGRIAYSLHDRVDIEPISYVFDGGWLYGRTSPGTKLSMIAHHRWVAFEVDEIESVFEWRSVVVKGAFYLVAADTPESRDPAYSHGVDLLRAIIPETLTANDPTPFRSSVFRIHLDEITGRQATMKGTLTA